MEINFSLVICCKECGDPLNGEWDYEDKCVNVENCESCKINNKEITDSERLDFVERSHITISAYTSYGSLFFEEDDYCKFKISCESDTLSEEKTLREAIDSAMRSKNGN